MIKTSLRTMIETSIAQGDLDALKRLAEVEGATAIRLDDDRQQFTTLHFAAAGGQLEMVAYLLSAEIGANPCAVSGNHFTPLHSAAMNGHASVCEELLVAGADPNVQTQPQGYAPLHSAAFAGHLAAIKVLLKFGAHPHLLNYRGEMPADTAKRQHQDAAEQLLRSVNHR